MKYLISIVGATASGKTDLALRFGKRYGASVISADSRQVYKGMNVGTAKPQDSELEEIDYHLRDVIEPTEEYNAGKFCDQVEPIIANSLEKKFFAILVGGSGLYLQSLWYGLDEMPKSSPEIRQALEDQFRNEGLANMLLELKKSDPETFKKIDHANPARIIRSLGIIRASGKPLSHFHGKREPLVKPYQDIKIGLTMDRKKLYSRINKRVDWMIENGLEQEFENILKNYGALPVLKTTIGYREWFELGKPDIDRKEVIRLIKRNSRRYAKRQYTWFRKYDDISWFEYDQHREIENFILKRMGI